jgi:hypothetical protein
VKSAIPSLILYLAASAIVAAQTVKIDKLSIRSREFTEVEVTKLDESRASVRHSGGIARVAIADLPEDVRKALGWKSEEEKKADEAAKFPQLVVEWDLKDESDRKINETLRKFLDANPKAVVLRLVLVVRGNGAEWNQAFIYDREAKHLLMMRRTTPPKSVIEHYEMVFWKSVPEDVLRQGIPWVDEEFKPANTSSKVGESPFDPPISYKDRPSITAWP